MGFAPYAAGAAEHLVRRGHRVTVVAGFPHLAPLQSWGKRSGAWSTEWHEGVEIRRRRHHVQRTQTAGQRALYEATLTAAGLTAIGMRPPPDVVLGMIPPLSGAVLAAAAGRLYRRPYGLVVQDVVGAAAEQSGVSGGARVAGAVRGLELALAREAAEVAVIAEGFRKYYESGGVTPSRIVRLRNWDLGGSPTESVERTRARLGWTSSEFVCLHGGNMGHKQGLDTVLDAAALLAGEGVRIVLAGDGNDRPRLERRAAHLGLANLSFAPPQPPGRYESALRAADVLLVNQRASVTDMALPSKLGAYFAAGRAVVAAVAPESETARELRAADAGMVVVPEDPGALAGAIRELRSSVNRRDRLGENGRAYAARELAGARILPEYERLIERVAAHR